MSHPLGEQRCRHLGDHRHCGLSSAFSFFQFPSFSYPFSSFPLICRVSPSYAFLFHSLFRVLFCIFFFILSIKLPCTYTPLLPFTIISLTSLFSFPVLRLFYSHFLSILPISFLLYLSFPSLVSLFSFPPLSFIPLSLPFLSSHVFSFSLLPFFFLPFCSFPSFLFPSFLVSLFSFSSLSFVLFPSPPLPVHSVIYSRLQYTL